MRAKPALLLAVILGVPTGALAQPAAEPPPLTLPAGARVRMRSVAAPGAWVRGTLVRADTTCLVLVPEGAPPLAARTLQFPIESVERFELLTGRKQHALLGLLAGAAVGVLAGFAAAVDPVACEYDVDYTCSRGQAITFGVLGFGVVGATVGGLVKTDRWTPVALDTLAPPAPRAGRVSPQLRALPQGGVTFGVAVGF